MRPSFCELVKNQVLASTQLHLLQWEHNQLINILLIYKLLVSDGHWGDGLNRSIGLSCVNQHVKSSTYPAASDLNRAEGPRHPYHSYLSDHYYPNGAAALPAFASAFSLRSPRLLPVLSWALSSRLARVPGQPQRRWREQGLGAVPEEVEDLEDRVWRKLPQPVFHFPS